MYWAERVQANQVNHPPWSSRRRLRRIQKPHLRFVAHAAGWRTAATATALSFDGRRQRMLDATRRQRYLLLTILKREWERDREEINKEENNMESTVESARRGLLRVQHDNWCGATSSWLLIIKCVAYVNGWFSEVYLNTHTHTHIKRTSTSEQTFGCLSVTTHPTKQKTYCHTQTYGTKHTQGDTTSIAQYNSHQSNMSHQRFAGKCVKGTNMV